MSIPDPCVRVVNGGRILGFRRYRDAAVVGCRAELSRSKIAAAMRIPAYPATRRYIHLCHGRRSARWPLRAMAASIGAFLTSTSDSMPAPPRGAGGAVREPQQLVDVAVTALAGHDPGVVLAADLGERAHGDAFGRGQLLPLVGPPEAFLLLPQRELPRPEQREPLIEPFVLLGAGYQVQLGAGRGRADRGVDDGARGRGLALRPPDADEPAGLVAEVRPGQQLAAGEFPAAVRRGEPDRAADGRPGR